MRKDKSRENRVLRETIEEITWQTACNARNKSYSYGDYYDVYSVLTGISEELRELNENLPSNCNDKYLIAMVSDLYWRNEERIEKISNYAYRKDKQQGNLSSLANKKFADAHNGEGIESYQRRLLNQEEPWNEEETDTMENYFS